VGCLTKELSDLGHIKAVNIQIPGQARAENQKGKNQPKRGSDDRASTQVVALTGHDLIQNVPQQTVNIVRKV
jgi:hypothetical protein